MEEFNSIPANGPAMVSVRAYRGDAMTFLAFDLHDSMLANFVGFTIHVKPKGKHGFYLLNRLAFPQHILDLNGIDDREKLSSRYSPFQKFNWVHVPATDHNVNAPFYGEYTYSVTPRYLVNGILQPMDAGKLVQVKLNVGPFEKNGLKVGFTRAFISSQAYVRRFGMNNQMRPQGNNLQFDVNSNSGTASRFNPVTGQFEMVPYSYLEQHKYTGWQVRDRVLEFLDEVVGNPELSLDVFAYDLNEPLVVDRLLTLGQQGRIRIILDNAGEHGHANGYEGQFETLYKGVAQNPHSIFRGKFSSLSHSKIFIQKKGTQAKKVLTGSTNFTTNGLYVNANHVLVFNDPAVATLYERVFNASFGSQLMKEFKTTDLATLSHVLPSQPDITFWFSPHSEPVATQLFEDISLKILNAKSDVLFAIMKDRSKSSILSAVMTQVKAANLFTYGITDVISNTDPDLFLYKPGSKRGVRIAARGPGVINILPPPFNNVPKIDGYGIHHKFVVVDFKGPNPAVYCGSSNLAFTPEQRNGDNLLEIRDRDVVTAFAIEAMRLVDHFHWRNRQQEDRLDLDDLSDPSNLWYAPFYEAGDLKFLQREMFIKQT